MEDLTPNMKFKSRFATAVTISLILASLAKAATTQKTLRYEAEDAIAVGGDGAVRTQANASGGEFYDYATSPGDYLEWTVNAESGGPAEIFFGYAFGKSGDRPLEIQVNGVVVAPNFSFPYTGPWPTWRKTGTLNINLNAGANTIRATAVNNIGSNIDYLQVKETIPLSGPIMTVYDGENLTGTSASVDATHVIYSDTTIPGGLNNQISSFVLSEGFMAVVADPADGVQPSKVYIAANGPLTINTLPTELNNTISFLRVVPWTNVNKKGFCGAGDDYRSNFDHSWYYSWTKGTARGIRTSGPEYVPMCWDERFAQIEDFLVQDQVSHLLSFNEPDEEGQANMPDIVQAVAIHKELQKAGLRLGSPACKEEGAFSSSSWLSQFMTEADAQGVRTDYINVHWYDWGSQPGTNTDPNPVDVANRLKAYLSNVYQRYRKPIWITEFNANGNRSRAIQDGFLQEIMPYLEDLGYIERYAYYQWNDSMRFVDESTDELTSTGHIYNDFQSSPAYITGELPGPWLDTDIGTTAEGASIYNGNFTISGSGTGIRSTNDSFRFVYQNFSGDVTITALVSSQIWRENRTMSGVMIRDSLDTDSKQAIMALSWSQGAKFRRRAATGASVTTTTDANIPKYPYWVRLVREGNTFTGYHSPDGITWTQLGSPATIAMGTDVYIGMAVTSYNDGKFNDTIFKNVSVTTSLSESIYMDWTRNSFAKPFVNIPTDSNPDGDTLTNLQEFAFGMDPTDPMGMPLDFVMNGDVTQAGTPKLMNFANTGEAADYRAVFLRRKDHVAAGLAYTVEFSADLDQWTTSGNAPTLLTNAASSGGLEAVSIPYPATVPASAGSENLPPKFFRVSVTQP